MQKINSSKLDIDVQSFLKHTLKVIKVHGLSKGISRLNMSIGNIDIDIIPVNKVEEIFKVVSTEFKIPVADLQKRTTKVTADAKQITYCLIKELLDIPYLKIANHLFINKATVVNAVMRLKRANPNVKVDKEFLEAYEICKSKLTLI